MRSVLQEHWREFVAVHNMAKTIQKSLTGELDFECGTFAQCISESRLDGNFIITECCRWGYNSYVNLEPTGQTTVESIQVKHAYWWTRMEVTMLKLRAIGEVLKTGMSGEGSPLETEQTQH